MLPIIHSKEIESFFSIAKKSSRKRTHKILHKKGAYSNEVFNFMLKDTYMQPHLHPENIMEESIHIIKGKLVIIFFDNIGKIKSKFSLEKGKLESMKIPCRTWHTYVMLTNKTCTYEQMFGVYNPLTWKIMADWAPKENSEKSEIYLQDLRNKIIE